jgi:predicted glycosyltransferase
MWNQNKIWIDLDNVPHVPFFVPIIEALEAKGFCVILTSRDTAPMRELLDYYHLESLRIGGSFGKYKILKIAGTFLRAFRLVPFVMRNKPLLALSHGSRAQLLFAAILRLPCLMMTDYEFADNSLTNLRSVWTMVPEIISDESLGVTHGRIFKYPGIKEDVYVPRFRPNPALKSELGLDPHELIVTVRPPAVEAHYHNSETDELFRVVIDLLAAKADTKIVVLPRNDKQATSIRREWPEQIANRTMIIPRHAVDALSLMWYSDLVISGGGTMNREAAALGVPVYSIFRGKIGAVDQFLASEGRLILLESPNEVASKIALVRRYRPANPPLNGAKALPSIVARIEELAQDLSSQRLVQGMDHV